MAKKAAKTTKAASETVKARVLKQPALAGMPRVRNAKLDKYAEGIGDCRDDINKAALDEKHYRSAALKEMQAKGITQWSHAGVDLVRVPGEDKLKVKTHKDGGSETGAGETEAEVVDPGPSGVQEIDPDEVPF